MSHASTAKSLALIVITVMLSALSLNQAKAADFSISIHYGFPIHYYGHDHGDYHAHAYYYDDYRDDYYAPGYSFYVYKNHHRYSSRHHGYHDYGRHHHRHYDKHHGYHHYRH